jgi:hypothetical protein
MRRSPACCAFAANGHAAALPSLRGDLISVRQQKTGTPLLIPLHPALRAAIEAAPSGHLTFLATAFGKARTANGFGTWFRKGCNAAGLPNGTSAHGLRKAA